MERLQKRIASCGYTSRRKAESLILEGRVKVNGHVVSELGYQVKNHDQIMIDDVILEKEPKVYYLLNKPRGVVATVKDDKKRKTVVELLGKEERIYPVGRLDYDTTGVILLTNDGEFANLLMHPKNEVDKVYIAKITGILEKEAIYKLKNGIMIEGKKTEKAKIKIRSIDYKKKTSIVEITIHEGRNHQVKKMFEAVSHPVLKLKRERFFIFDLKGLKSGEYRRLTRKEVAIVYGLKKNKKLAK